MTHADRHPCPAWCVAQHDSEDEGGRRRHRGVTMTVPGIALRGAAPHDPHDVDLLVEMHADDGEPFVAIYIGDGVNGLDVTIETAARLVPRLIEALQASGASEPATAGT